jgi:hypothetical protein
MVLAFAGDSTINKFFAIFLLSGLNLCHFDAQRVKNF